MPGIVTVTVAATTSALTTTARAKSWLGITTSADDAYIAILVDMASAIVADHCGRALGAQTVSEVFRFGAGSYIGPSAQAVAPYGTPLLNDFRPLVTTLRPFVGALTITENSDAALTAGTDYETRPTAGLLWRLRSGMRSWWNIPTVTVVYRAGWQLIGDSPAAGLTALPSSIESVVLSLIQAAYGSRGRDPRVTLDLTEGVGRQAFAAGGGAPMTLTGDMRATLAPYRDTET